MPLLAGDIRFARSVNMADVPEGGGPPSSQLLTSGRSNEVFPDISEETRTVGRVEIYQIFSVLRNSDRTPLLGGNVILAEPPADPNISITLLTLKNPFATRADIVQRMESGMSPGSEWGGYLLEDHYTTMRSLTLFQRPGMPPPTIGRTYLLIFDENLPSERRQRVRIKAANTEQRSFTEVVNGQLIDFQAQVTTCELFDGLLYDFPGSPPSRTFARNSTKTKTRETVYSDSGMFYGASPLVQPTAINDVWLKVASIYTQVVPNSRTEVASVDQYPSARKTLTLASAPREIKVGITPHTQRIRIAEENAGVIYVALLKPLPAPGTVFIDFWSLGNRYTLTDDGEGRITGQGSGSVNYLTGALSVTLKSLPDIGSSITISHGEKSAYTNRSGQAGFRAPEFAWTMPHSGIKPSSVVVTWQSGGVLKTATDNGSGGFTGDASGEIGYAAGKIYLRPTAMIDAGGEFATDYEYTTEITEHFQSVSPDAGGFAALTLALAPAPRSITVRWVTVRNVSNSSGSSDLVSSSGTTPPNVAAVSTFPTLVSGGGGSGGGNVSTGGWSGSATTMIDPGQASVLKVNAESLAPGGSVQLAFYAGTNGAGEQNPADGTYRWAGASLDSLNNILTRDVFQQTEGNFTVTSGVGIFSVATKASCPDVQAAIEVSTNTGEVLAPRATFALKGAAPPAPAPAPENVPKRYNFIKIAYGSTKAFKPGETRAFTFYTMTADDTYSWEIVKLESDGTVFPVMGGTFEVVAGRGDWTITVPNEAVAGNFRVIVLFSNSDIAATEGWFYIATEQPSYTPEPPAAAAIQVRDPITSEAAISGPSQSIAGVYAGGVTKDGRVVYVYAPVTTSEEWGDFYHAPAYSNTLWSEDEVARQEKILRSNQGQLLAYEIWGIK